MDPQKYHVVVLIAALLVADDDAHIFSGRPDALILSLLLNQYFLSLLSPRMPGVLLLLPSSLTASEDNRESINKRLLLSQNQCHPHNCCWGRARKSLFLHFLLPRCQLLFHFVVFVSLTLVLLLRAVLVDFINDREPDATVRPCRCVLSLLLN